MLDYIYKDLDAPSRRPLPRLDVKTRIRHKADSEENWLSSELEMMPGEIAVSYQVIDGKRTHYRIKVCKEEHQLWRDMEYIWTDPKLIEVSSFNKDDFVQLLSDDFANKTKTQNDITFLSGAIDDNTKAINDTNIRIDGLEVDVADTKLSIINFESGLSGLAKTVGGFDSRISTVEENVSSTLEIATETLVSAEMAVLSVQDVVSNIAKNKKNIQSLSNEVIDICSALVDMDVFYGTNLEVLSTRLDQSQDDIAVLETRVTNLSDSYELITNLSPDVKTLIYKANGEVNTAVKDVIVDTIKVLSGGSALNEND